MTEKIEGSKFLDSMILGSLLGDGSIEMPTGYAVNPRISFTQATWEKDYIDYKHDLCNELYKTNNVREAHNNTYRFGISSKEKILTESMIAKTRYENNTRKLPKIDEINPVVILFWYLDDGSLTITETKRKNRKNSLSRKLKISLQSYKDDDILKFISDFKKKYDIEFKPQYETIKGNKKIVSICLNNNLKEIIKFMDLIYPYKNLIPECMHYKFCICYKKTLQMKSDDYSKYNNCDIINTGICTCRKKDFSHLL